MAQPESLIISQDTIGTGVAGEAWKGGSLADAGGGKANVVRIINTAPQSANTVVALLWVPHDSSGTKLDVLGQANLTQVGPHEWTFEPTSGVWGKWRIRAREVVAAANVDEVRIFGIASPAAGVYGPAFNEDADPVGSLLSGAGSIADSEDNEGGTIDGWLKDLRRTAEKVESLFLGGGLNPSEIQRGLTWTFDGASQADSNPGAGKFRADNATPSSASEIFIHPLSLSGVGMNALLALQDTPGFLYVEQVDDVTRWVLYDVTAVSVAGGGYQKLQVTINGVPPADEIQDGKAISFAFLVPPAPLSVAHADTTGQTADDHHAEVHTIASHDTTATGAELETLTDGSNADGLHGHAAPSHAATTGQTADDHHDEAHTIASHSDTSATGAEMDELTDGSETVLHTHAPIDNVTGLPWSSSKFVAPFTAAKGVTSKYDATVAGAIVITLPGSPVDGEEFAIKDVIGGNDSITLRASAGVPWEHPTNPLVAETTADEVFSQRHAYAHWRYVFNAGAWKLLGNNLFHTGNVTQTGTPLDNFITGAAGADNGAGPGAAGDDAGILSGDGGDGTTGGGAAGTTSVIGADGGDSSVSGDGGLGGFVAISGGKGGAADGATGDGADGGDLVLTGGTGGPSANENGGNGGDLSLQGGNNNGGLDGQLRLGDANTREILTGNTSGKPKFTHQGGTRTPVSDVGAISAATATLDLEDSDHFKFSITGACTLAFANLSDGQSGTFQITHDAAAATLAKGAGVTTPGGSIGLSAGMGDVDMGSYLVEGANVRVWIEGLAFS